MVRRAFLVIVGVAAGLGAPATASAQSGHWTRVGAHVPGFGCLFAVSATSSSDAWAVGDVEPQFDGDRSLIEHWDGSRWRVVSVPHPPRSGDNVLHAVAAVSPTDVWALGHTAKRALILHWNGGRWRVAPPPLGAEHADLRAVSVVSAADIWAVGRNRAEQALVVHYDGVAWRAVPSVHPVQLSELESVSAVSASDVWAVGDIGFNFHSFAEHWNGTSWRRVSTPDQARQLHRLDAVVALSATNAWAAGSRLFHGATRDMVQHWNGSVWTITSSPNATEVPSGIASSRPSDIWTVGTTVRLNGSGDPWSEHWDGSSWSSDRSARAGLVFGGSFDGIAHVPATTTYWAVGEANDEPLIETRS